MPSLFHDCFIVRATTSAATSFSKPNQLTVISYRRPGPKVGPCATSTLLWIHSVSEDGLSDNPLLPETCRIMNYKNMKLKVFLISSSTRSITSNRFSSVNRIHDFHDCIHYLNDIIHCGYPCYETESSWGQVSESKCFLVESTPDELIEQLPNCFKPTEHSAARRQFKVSSADQREPYNLPVTRENIY